MNATRNFMARGAIATASVLMLSAPAIAQAPPPSPNYQQQVQPQPGPPPKKKHHSGVGAGIAAGVLGGIAGAAIVGSQANRPQPYDNGYAPPPPPPPGPRYGAYDADDEVDCRVVRKPVYDEDGEVVSYKTRRICR